MSKLFQNHSPSSMIYKHNKLPLYISEEFNFYRCIPFDDTLYQKTVSELHSGNLRRPNIDNRYSTLFHDKKVSYWANSMDTALAEFRKDHSNANRIMFWSYDDPSSFFPTTDICEPLKIIDGLDSDFETILDKHNNHVELDDREIAFINEIEREEPDCFAYKSHAKKDGINFLFFEKGFKKLSLREVTLKVESRKKRIICSSTSDYLPDLESYGKYFYPIAKVRMDNIYLKSEEYKMRKFFEEQNNPLKRGNGYE